VKAAVVHYTRFGHNDVIAKAIAEKIGAEQFRIEIPGKPSFPVMGFCSMFNVRMRIKPMKADFSNYDLVVLCTPIWAWKPAPPARTFLSEAKLPRRLALSFSTGGGPIQRAEEKMRQLLAGRDIEIVAVGEINTDKTDEEYLKTEARAFADRLAPG
jgi:flavodoxin